VKQLSIICDIDLIGQNKCHGCKIYWFVRSLFFCACVNVFAYALEDSRVYDMYFLFYIVLPLYTGMYILTVYMKVGLRRDSSY